MRNVMDKWGPLALFVSANISRGSARIVKVIWDVNAYAEVFNGGVLKENQGLRLSDLRQLFAWLEKPGITLTKLEVNRKVRAMKIKLFLYYMVASPTIPIHLVHPSISMLQYATSRTLGCMFALHSYSRYLFLPPPLRISEPLDNGGPHHVRGGRH
jgi:hypothetical protein